MFNPTESSITNENQGYVISNLSTINLAKYKESLGMMSQNTLLFVLLVYCHSHDGEQLLHTLLNFCWGLLPWTLGLL